MNIDEDDGDDYDDDNSDYDNDGKHVYGWGHSMAAA